MAFLSDELESLYKEWKNRGSVINVNKEFGTLIAHKFDEGHIKTTKDMVANVIYINGIVNRSTLVKYLIIPHNIVVRIVLDNLPEEMAKKPYNLSQTLKEKLEELEKETL